MTAAAASVLTAWPRKRSRAITRTAANEWGQYGITSNVFLPIIATENFRTTQPAALKALEERSPLHRIGTTEEDCGPIIAFLASEDSGYFNGQSFMLDGGCTCTPNPLLEIHLRMKLTTSGFSHHHRKKQTCLNTSGGDDNQPFRFSIPIDKQAGR